MSITVRLWLESDFIKIVKGDRWLTTLLANANTFSGEMLKVAQSTMHKLKHYDVIFGDNEPKRILATDYEMLFKFIKAEYSVCPDQVWEVKCSYKNIPLPKQN